MAAEIEQSSFKHPIPEIFIEQIAYDCNKNILYIERNAARHPLFKTWVWRHEDCDKPFTTIEVEADQIAKLREDGLRITAQSDDDDLKVRARALELIMQAAQYGASDLHFMMKGTHTEIQIGVKGGLKVLNWCDQNEGVNLARAIYQGIATDRDTQWNPNEFQNAQISGSALPPEFNLASIRIVRGPCYPQEKGGSFLSMRLQRFSATVSDHSISTLPALGLPRKPDGQFNLDKLGFTSTQIEKIKSLMTSPDGMVFISGPTGSGKTNTLCEILREIARIAPHRRHVGVEDPVENPMPFMVQLSINDTKNDSDTGQAFADRIRVMLRMAPKIILIGELRGAVTASSAISAAMTGHQVWTTIHITDPFLFAERLELMDSKELKPKIFCDHNIIRGSIAQRLLPRLCQECSYLLPERPDALSATLKQSLSTWGDLSKIRIKGDGCRTCDYDGTTSRFAVAEVVITNAELMRDLLEHGSETARKNYRARQDADPSMLDAAIGHILEGNVDAMDVQEIVGQIQPKETMC